MREILFRAKGDNTGIWHYGYVERKCYCCGSVWVIHVPPETPEDRYESYPIDPNTIGQYTMQVDKNGKRIFEGDIIFAEGYRAIVRVGAFGYADPLNRNTRLGFYFDWERLNKSNPAYRKDILFWTQERTVEVAGNIYDNITPDNAPDREDQNMDAAQEKIIVYTDGSSLENGSGDSGCGWACKLIYAGRSVVKAGRDTGKTNNQMEITAIIKAMQSIRDKAIPVEVYSDSEYAVKILNGKNTAKKNLGLWRIALAERDKFSCIKFRWVKGHAEDQHNAEVERAARQEAERSIKA